MKRPDFFRLRLSIRLALLVFLVEALLLGSFALVIYYFCENQFYQSFDNALQANAEAIATLIEKDEEGLELEFADEVMQRFSRKKRPDLFAVILPGGAILEKSSSLDELPMAISEEENRIRFGDFRFMKQIYRGIVIPVVRGTDEANESSGGKSGVSVFFGACTHDIEEQLEEITEFLLWFFSAGLVISGLLAGLVVWRGLAPLRRLTRATGTIGENTLNQRLPVDGLPPDLMPLTRAMNALLDRLERAFERERRFSADAAHEIRTPVATLKSGIQAALLNPPNEQEDRKTLQDLLEDVHRLEDLCNSLLLVASGQIDSSRDGMEVEGWIGDVESALESLRPLAESHLSHLEYSIPDSFPKNIKVRADSTSTRRVVTNLVDNAIRHGGTEKKIAVRVECDESAILLIVEDDGPGVSKEDIPRLFERFFRVDQARARSKGGTGLGLAICRSLVEAWGGDIRYEPIAPHGSRLVWLVRSSKV